MNESPTIKPRRKGRSGMQAMLIPSQQMVAQLIRSVPQGVRTDLGALRRRLSAQYGEDARCPVTVQRHLRAIAELSFGALAKGEPVSTVTPYWRLVDPASPLAARLAGGPVFIRERLDAERPERS
ncbi:hypothetical protein ABID08_000895 [Rhizobium binae]|uniref:Integrase n=1 Tax=Rhizobium binae TaxID=1138190 RepID=A0ABV2MAR6_9HYPH|nr:hypothetical protein [Rhizobium binae]NKL46578.1 hypothetical protein [Rhizobium leguminosarum bv. viciae]MBX4929179.1 hypothetical protein [Rhizobium binae]MBX4969672.1 hypothetical protein [Rhizobium binae]MBX4992456.1 hypothetical protein [Rhizobium binae]QSY80585.1 hypothetical protein J2J99_12690 [Rhizobium binae]